MCYLGRVLIFFGVMVGMALALLDMAAGTVWGAPAPVEKKAHPQAARLTAGSYAMIWNDLAYVLTLNPDGTQSHVSQSGTPWTGSWSGKIHQGGGLLLVSEEVLGGQHAEWELPLRPAGDGWLTGEASRRSRHDDYQTAVTHTVRIRRR